MIGDLSPPEWRHHVDPDTGREVTELTTGRGHSYPLYYFVPSITRDGRYLVFHSERTGWVQLHRLDLDTGEIGQLSEGRSTDSGWAIWCEWRLRGIYNHLSALNLPANEVFYFADGGLRATHVETFENRLVRELPPDRHPVSQSAFSPDGSLFAYIHVDRARFAARMSEREVLENMGLFGWDDDHGDFRRSVPATLSVVDTRTGEQRDIIEPGFYFHHALFLDDETLLLNHPPDGAGMWTVDLTGGQVRHLRPADAPGAHGAAIVHQVITARGIVYEATRDEDDGTTTTYLGCYDRQTGGFEEVALPVTGYVHTGFDPAGRFAFIEHAGQRHELFSVHPAAHADRTEVRLLRTLRSPMEHQRDHAHPFLSPDRTRVLFTDRSASGYNQVHAMRVEDLVADADQDARGA